MDKQKAKMGRPPLGKKMAFVGISIPEEVKKLLGDRPSVKAQEIILNYFKQSS
jgi:hypothetical protein